MALLQFIAGTTVDLLYDFFTVAGERTPVDNPYAKIFTPQKSEYATVSLSSIVGVTGRYDYLFAVPSGLTVGHWSTVGVGFTNNSNLFSSVQPFEIIELSLEPLYIGVQDLRDYLAIPDTDHSKDDLYHRLLLTAVSLIEKYIRRQLGVHSVSETFHIGAKSVLILKEYPVIEITGMTASNYYTGSLPNNPNIRGIPANNVNANEFYFDLNKENGIMSLLDSVGNECFYYDTHIEIDYSAGYLSVPEDLRSAILMLASNMFNVSQSEGLSIMRLGDLQFSFEKNLLTPKILDILDNYKNIKIK